jgi:hypothetical protein
MSAPLHDRVRAAAVAGCQVLVIDALFVLVQWLLLLWARAAQPAWIPALWGADSWAQVQTAWLWVLLAGKLLWWLLALVVIWLGLWSRRLQRLQS